MSPAAGPHAAAAPGGSAEPSYLGRLATRSAATGTVLCLGIDPDPESLPAGFSHDLPGVEAFARLLLEAAGPAASAVKPNLAFFEAFGSAGIAALERLRAAIPGDLPVVIDAKRGDIGTTAARQAAALYDGLGADAITVSPYLGEEAIAPLIARPDRFAYVLCRTSNPGAGELQGLGSWSGRPHPRSSPRSASWRRDWRSSCPASAPRAETRPPSLPMDGRPRHLSALGPAAGS